MLKMVRAATIVAAVLVLAGCTSSRMTAVSEPTAIANPQAGKATVVFYRSSGLGGAIQSSVFDVTADPPAFVGIVSTGMKLAYATSPGRHRFMVIGESADFMDADLVSGSTYYALVAPRVGWWKARFSLRPRLADDQQTRDELTSCKWYDNTPASYEWAQQHMAEVEALENKYLPEFLAKESEKPMLHAGDGTQAAPSSSTPAAPASKPPGSAAVTPSVAPAAEMKAAMPAPAPQLAALPPAALPKPAAEPKVAPAPGTPTQLFGDEAPFRCPDAGTEIDFRSGLTRIFSPPDHARAPDCAYSVANGVAHATAFGPYASRVAQQALRRLWPLRIGKRVSFATEVSFGRVYNERYRVVRHERVTVPAGTFDAFVIDWDATSADQYANGYHETASFWYAPALGYVVKVEHHLLGGIYARLADDEAVRVIKR